MQLSYYWVSNKMATDNKHSPKLRPKLHKDKGRWWVWLSFIICKLRNVWG